MIAPKENKKTGRVLVTGGLGFIGFNLAARLSELGFDVVILDKNSDIKSLPKIRAEILIEDVCELNSRTGPLSGPFDFIFHQASLTDPRYANDREMYDQNVGGFDRILNLAREKGAKLIYASTAGIYGHGPCPMREDQPPDILTMYGKSKLVMEKKAQASAEHSIVGLRYFNVYGPHESHKGRPASMVYHLWKQIRETAVARLFKSGGQRRDFIYVQDIVDANLCAMKSSNGVYNVGTGAAPSFNDLVLTLGEVMGRDIPIEYFEMPYDPKTYQSFTQADTARAENLLGFRAGWNLKQGIGDYVNFLNDLASSQKST